MSERGCPSCQFWKPTEMEAVPTSRAPHHVREAEHRTELMRATEALCTWRAGIVMPPWADKRIGGGNLTSEDDGKDCPVWARMDEKATMDDAAIRRIIKLVADEAWQIASDGNASPAVCLAIEGLSDDPETCARLVAEVRAMLAAKP